MHPRTHACTHARCWPKV